MVSGRLSPAHRPRRHHDRHRAGPRHRVVPAVPQPLGGRAGLRRRTARCTRAAATAPASTTPTTARPATRRRGGPLPPTLRAARCGPSPCAARRHRRLLNGSMHPASTPTTGAGLPGNPYARERRPQRPRGSIAYGLRNPFRFTIRPGTNEVWAGDVGWNTWEEINRRRRARRAPVANFGWPCFEGTGRQPVRRREPDRLREPVHRRRPDRAVLHLQAQRQGRRRVTPARPAARRSPASRSTPGGNYPAAYRARCSSPTTRRSCIWAMPRARTACRTRRRSDASSATRRARSRSPAGPGGDLYYVDLAGGTVHRISYTTGNSPPVASVSRQRLSGPRRWPCVRRQRVLRRRPR